MANYPNDYYTPREKENWPGVIFDPEKKNIIFKEDFDSLEEEIKAIEQELGLNLKGDYENLKQRIENDESNIEKKAETFLDLEDTPENYTGNAGKTLIVNNEETGLVFADLPSGGGGDSVVVALPGEGYGSGTLTDTNYPGNGVSTQAIRFQNNTNQNWYFSVKVPKGQNAIDKIEVIYRNQNETGNLYLRFRTILIDYSAIPGYFQRDISEEFTTYNVSNKDVLNRKIVVPSTAYNELTVEENDVITLMMERDATNANDTYESSFYVIAVYFFFKKI